MSNTHCGNCKYKNNIPGDSHISCRYPLLAREDAIKISMMAFTNPSSYNQILKENFGFTGSLHGIQSGWFMFPDNFDPTWIEGSCQKHSDIIGEAVEYQQSLDRCLNPYKVLFVQIEKGEKSKEEYQYILSAYDKALEAPKGLGEATEEVKSKARIQLVKDLESAHSLLLSHKEVA